MAKGLIPSLSSGSSALVVAAVATIFSIVGAFYQIQLVREKGWTEEQFPEARRDAALGSVILGALSVVIMIAAAAVLNPVGATVSSPADMAVILEPALGAGRRCSSPSGSGQRPSPPCSATARSAARCSPVRSAGTRVDWTQRS